MAGVFSHTGLDKGSEILLAKAPFTPLSHGSTVVDLGCGWGALTLPLAAEHPESRAIAVDVNERARQLTALNTTEAHTPVEVLDPDAALSAVRAAGGIDLLWSNPPVRIGKTALHSLLDPWLAQLKPEGKAFLVINKNLGADSLAAWLNDRGYTTERIASKKAFRVLQVHH